MKIDNSLKNVAGVPAKSKVERRKSGDAARSQGSVEDSVDFTAQASLMRSLEAALGDMPDTDVGKVEAVRQAIAEGHFKVDEEVVADKLVEETMETLRHASKHA